MALQNDVLGETVETETAATRKQRYRPAETRERILAASRTLFAQHGYLNTSTQEIAGEADVAEGSIFYHFGSKKNLLAALGVSFAQEMVVAMRGGSDDLSDLEPGVTIARAFQFVEDHGFSERLLGLSFDSPEVQPFMIASREVVVSFISQCYAATMPENIRCGLDIDMAASMAFAAVCDALCLLQAAPDEKAKAHILEHTTGFVRQALGYPHNWPQKACGRGRKR